MTGTQPYMGQVWQMKASKQRVKIIGLSLGRVWYEAAGKMPALPKISMGMDTFLLGFQPVNPLL